MKHKLNAKEWALVGVARTEMSYSCLLRQVLPGRVMEFYMDATSRHFQVRATTGGKFQMRLCFRLDEPSPWTWSKPFSYKDVSIVHDRLYTANCRQGHGTTAYGRFQSTGKLTTLKHNGRIV